MSGIISQYEEALDVISNIRDKIVSGEELAKDDYIELKHSLEALPDKTIDEYSDDIDYISLDGLIKRYDIDVKQVKKQLRDVLTAVVGGNSLDSDLRIDLDNTLDELTDIRERLYNSSWVELRDMSLDSNSTVYEYYNAIKNTRKMNEIATALKVFGLIYSDDDDLDLELAPKREEANNLLERIESESSMTYDEVKSAAMEYVIFVDIVKEEDDVPEITQQMLAFLRKKYGYSEKVISALGDGYFYVDDRETEESVEIEVSDGYTNEVGVDLNGETDNSSLGECVTIDINDKEEYSVVDAPATFMKPIAFLYKDKLYEVSSWIAILLEITNDLYTENPDILKNMITEKKALGRVHVKLSYNKEDMRRPREIANSGIYIESNRNAHDIKRYILAILGRYDVPTESLKIYFE